MVSLAMPGNVLTFVNVPAEHDSSRATRITNQNNQLELLDDCNKQPNEGVARDSISKTAVIKTFPACTTECSISKFSLRTSPAYLAFDK